MTCHSRCARYDHRPPQTKKKKKKEKAQNAAGKKADDDAYGSFKESHAMIGGRFIPSYSDSFFVYHR